LNQLEFTKFLSNFDFVEKTREQIIKDFNRCGWQIELKIDSIAFAKEELTQQIAFHLSNFSTTELQQFIYTVDLQENKFLSAVTMNDDYQSLASEILKREALKVFIRSNYSH
jgi:hypothetical protein